jgi:hypothetical protein
MALSNDDLSKIKGGAMSYTCEEAYEYCAEDTNICYPNYWEPTPGWYACMERTNPNCSPLMGWRFCEP